MVLLPMKRRRVSLFTLPLVVAIGFVLVARLAAWQRSDLIADLADRIAHGEPREAIDAVRKLAAMPNPPIATLVVAAAADEHETAEAAQVSISRLLRRWQRDIESKQHLSAVASHLSELAQSLAENQNEFANTDHPWLASTARKIVRLANMFPPQKTPTVALHCDAILMAPGDSPPTRNATTVASGGVASAGNSTENHSNPPSEAMADPEDGSMSADDSPANAPSASIELLLDSDDDTGEATDSSAPAGDAQNSSIGTKIESAQRLAVREPPRRLDRSPRIMEISPGTPITVAPVERAQIKVVESDTRSALPNGGQTSPVGVSVNAPPAETESRQLLRRWLSAENGEVQAIEHELARRGFGKLTTRLVRQFFSDDAEERMRLVDDLLAQPGTGAGAWLLLLAEDSDAEVRLFAVTLMATSNDGQLMEKAWQVALRDRDPRIADLAGRLRERRAGSWRR